MENISQCNKLLLALLKGRKLSFNDARDVCSSNHVPRRMKDLIERGTPIESEWVVDEDSRFKKWFISKENRDLLRRENNGKSKKRTA